MHRKCLTVYLNFIKFPKFSEIPAELTTRGNSQKISNFLFLPAKKQTPPSYIYFRHNQIHDSIHIVFATVPIQPYNMMFLYLLPICSPIKWLRAYRLHAYIANAVYIYLHSLYSNACIERLSVGCIIMGKIEKF